MPITTTDVGRAKLKHPDLAFDNNDGGVLLHAKITTMWTDVSNHLPSRYSGPNTLAAAATLNIVHNFGLAIGKLKFIFFESGVQLTQAQVTANYTTTQISVDEIQITNITGGPLTFSVMMLAFRLGVTSDDVDPSFGAMWDTTNGESFKNNLYKNGNFTHSTATQYYDMYIDGDLTLGANLVIHGNLFVSGQILSSGIAAYQLTVKKNIYAGNGADFSSSGDFIVGGDLISASTFNCRNSTSTVQSICSIGGDLIVLGDFNALGFDATTGVDRELPGFNTTVRGNAVVAGISTAGAREGATTAGGHGGSITIRGNVVASSTITSGGMSGTGSFNGGDGGNIFIGGHAVIGGTGILGLGGASGGSGTSDRGTSGSVKIGGNVTRHNTSFGTNVTIYSFGGGASTSGRDGRPGNLIQIGGNCHTSINIGGGSGLGSGNGGVAGVLKVKGSIIGDSEASITITANGGGGVNSGAGGTILVLGDIIRSDVSYQGGTASGAGTAGSGGTLTVYGSIIETPIGCVGGNVGSGTGAGNAGDGGTITVYGDYLGKTRTITLTGGNQSGTATGRGGTGGTAIFKGDVICTLVTASAGTQPATSVSKADGGSLTVEGDFRGNFTANGNNAISPTSTQGGRSGQMTIGGSFYGTLTLIGGNGLTTGGFVWNTSVGKDFKGNAVLTGGNAVATSGAATGGNIGFGANQTFLVGGDVDVTSFICTPGNATDVGLTTGIGGSYAATGALAFTVRGNFRCSGAVSFKGGDGLTTGGNSAEVRLYGEAVIFGQLNVSGGNATNGAGQAGKVSDFHLAKGGFIDSFYAVPTLGIANTAVSTIYLMGYLTIREWNVSLTYYPSTKFLQKLNSAILTAGSVSSMVMITTRTADGGTDGTDALNDIFPRTGTAAQAAIHGRYNGANTVWKYRTFNNT